MAPTSERERGLAGVARLWARSLAPGGLVFLAAVGALAVALIPLYVWGANVALVLGIDGGQQITPRQLTTLLVVALGPWFVVLALVSATVVGALAVVAARLDQGEAARPMAAFRAGLRRSPRVVLVLGGALGSILVAFVATPFLVVVGALGLVLTPLVRLVQRRRPGLPWPATRTLVVLLVPFGLAAVLVVRWAAVLPAVALERASVRGAFARSAAVTRGHLRRVATVAAAFVVVPVVALGVLNDRVLGDATGVVGPQLLSTLTGLLVLSLAVVAAVALFGDLAGPVDLASVDVTPPDRTRSIGALVVFAVLATAIPLGLVWTRPASAAPGATFTVDDRGDAPDASPGDGVCDDGTGACTLRAALDEANASADAVIGFAVDGTIVVGSSLVIRQPVTIDGSGHRVTVSGGGTVSVLATQIEIAGGGSATLRAVTVADGYDGSTGGAAIYNGGASGGAGLVLDRVTIRDNATAPGAMFGGAVVNSSKLTVRNSTFSGNDADPSTDGSDIANVFSGTASISQTTFVGSTGSSALASSSANPADVTNSLVSGAGFACSGSFTGSGNVTTDATAICPGASGATPASLATAALADNGGSTDTVRLRPGSIAVDAGGAAACPSIDQRGTARPKGAACDAGAYELDPATTTRLEATPTSTGFGGAVLLDASVRATGEPVTPTGRVELFDGGTSLGTVVLDGDGDATKEITSLSVGPHDLTAVYVPDAGLAVSTSPARRVTVDAAESTVVLTSSGSPSRRGEAVTFHVAVTGADGGVPTGTVTLRDGTTVVQAVALDAAGTADVVTSTLAGGPHVMVAEYSGDASRDPATSAPLGHAVVGGTTTVLRAPPAPTVYGNAATFEVTVTADGAGPTPTGGVILVAGASNVGMGMLGPDGTASIAVDQLPPGTNSVIATYAGDGFNDTSTSPAASHVVTAADTATSLTVSPSSSTPYGSAVTLGVAVTASDTPAIPSGTVTIYDGATVLIAVGLQPDGTATTDQVLAAGRHDLHAEFAGPPGFRPSTGSAVRHDVTPARTSVAVSAGAAASVTGEQVVLTATVRNGDTAPVPIGSVTFWDGTTELGTAVVDGSGTARLDTRALGVGTRTLTAEYAGGANFAAATSAGLTHRVDRAEVQVLVAASPSRSWFGSLVTVDATVAPVAPGTGLPTGSVTFRDGATTLGTVVLDGSGRASLGTYGIGVGSRPLTVEYPGDAGFRPGTGTTIQTVDPDSTTVTVLSSDPDQRYGRPVELTAAVVGTGVGVPTGTVTFTGAGRTLGTTTLDGSGRARITVSDLPVASTLITASYAGDGRFTAGTGTLVQRVTAASTATVLTVVPAAPSVADVVTLTATATAPGSEVVPRGNVEFTDNGVLLASVPVDATGTATLSRRFDRSSHELQARLVGSTSWLASASNRETIAPTRISAPLTVTATPSAVALGGTVTLRASLPASDGVGVPTGVINFTGGSGSLGSAPLVGGVATLDVAAPLVPGAWVVNGWYPGDARYEPVAPTPVTVVVGAAPTTVAVATIPNPGYALDGPVIVRAHVTSPYGGAPITGVVRFSSDSPALTSQPVAVGPDGFAEITIVDVPAGTWNVRAAYEPSSGSAFAGSSGASVHRSVKRSAAVAITATSGLQVGRTTRVSVAVTDTTGSVHRPSGPVEVDAGDGLSCTASAPVGSCDVVLPSAGPVTFTATYTGDDRFDGDTATATALVRTATPTLRASSTTRRWVTGDPITIDWTLGGPTTGTVTVQSAFGVACTGPVAAAGTCTATLPFDARGQRVDFAVAYSGDAGWDPAFATVGDDVEGCYPVAFVGVPAAAGTVTGPDGNCNGGAGSIDGTPVTAIATPAPGYVLDRWLETDSTAQAYRFTVGEETRSATAVFELDCVPVTYRAGQAPGVDPAGSASGYVALSTAPDCGAPPQRDPATGTTTAAYRRGTALQATAVSSAATTGEFKGWAVLDGFGRATYPTEPTIDLDLSSSVDLTANFGARCYQPQVSADGPGRASIATAPNCREAAREGYVYGTQVAIDAEPGPFHLLGPITTDAGATVDPAAFAVRADTPITVRFDPCRQLTVATTGSGRGTVDVSESSTCPGGEPGWYAPGEITLSPVAAPGYSGKLGLPVEPDRFKRWIDGDGLPIQERAPLLRLDMSQDRHITAVFTSPSRCAPIDLRTASPAWLGGLAVRQASELECDSAQEYVQGEPFSLEAAAVQGSPLVQWKVSGLEDYAEAALSGKSTAIPTRTRYRSHLPGGTVAVPGMYGDVTATAYACAALTTDVGLIGDDGNPVDGAAPDGFVRFDSAPSCPGTGNGWLVGDTVAYLAGAQPVGYQFVRWDGDVSGTDQEGSIRLDGSRPSTALRPVYQVQCYTLTVTPEANTVRGDDPDCPGADPSRNRYVGGSVVALHAFDGGEVWVGWEGDVDRSQDPTWVYVDHDVTAHATWRDKTTNEDIKDFFTDVAHVLAVGAKKLVGVAIVAATALLDSAFTAAMGAITLVSSAIDAIAGALGAPTSDGFREAMAGIQQTAALFSSPFSCGAEWAFADGGSAGDHSSLDGTGGDLKDLLKDPRKLGDKIGQYRSSLEEIEQTSSGWAASVKKFGVRAKVAKSAGGTALTAVGIGTALASGGVGFESTAEEAWGGESGRAFMSCMEDSLPDYWNVPPLGFSDS